MRFVTFCLVVVVLGLMTSPSTIIDEEAVIGGDWCTHVSVDDTCPPPEGMGGAGIAPLCAAVNVTAFRAGWPLDQLDVLPGNGNCTQKKVGIANWPGGHLQLASEGDCWPHIAWVPW